MNAKRQGDDDGFCASDPKPKKDQKKKKTKKSSDLGVKDLSSFLLDGLYAAAEEEVLGRRPISDFPDSMVKLCGIDLRGSECLPSNKNFLC